jgi:hypothetical protein
MLQTVTDFDPRDTRWLEDNSDEEMDVGFKEATFAVPKKVVRRDDFDGISVVRSIFIQHLQSRSDFSLVRTGIPPRRARARAKHRVDEETAYARVRCYARDRRRLRHRPCTSKSGRGLAHWHRQGGGRVHQGPPSEAAGEHVGDGQQQEEQVCMRPPPVLVVFVIFLAL